MSRSNHRDAARTIRNDNRSSIRVEDFDSYPDLVPDDRIEALAIRVVLDAVLHEHRRTLVAAAQRHLGQRSAAEDMVQDICLDVLEGQLRLPIDPGVALDALLYEIAERCEEREEREEGDDR